MINTQNFDELIGKEFTLYKSNLLNHFQLNNTLYEVLEDESDGYRSMMKHVAIVDDEADTGYYSENLGKVIIEKASPKYNSYSGKFNEEDEWQDNDFEGYQIKDIQTDHVWLIFGTDNMNDYYPVFTYNWKPKII